MRKINYFLGGKEMEKLQIEYCPTCGNVVEKIEDHRVPLMCCGQKLQLLKPNSTEAAIEKHQPVISQENGTLLICVGEVEHPSVEAHWIPWVVIRFGNEVHRYSFEAGQKTIIELPCPASGMVVEAMAYCNLHGLWSTEYTVL